MSEVELFERGMETVFTVAIVISVSMATLIRHTVLGFDEDSHCHD